MQVKRDPQNGYAATIDNAIRGAYIRAELSKSQPGQRFSMPEEAFFRIAGEMIAQALGLSDAPPNGIWIVYSDDINRVVHSVHFDEVEAHRVVQRNGYFMTVKFVEFGDPDLKEGS